MKYRAEIDGLRACAVVPVILFHAGFEVFSGGFIGVDVFFVISGYLITTIIVEDIEKNCFSIPKFYERRARRILPALFLVMLVCIPFAWMWMMPNQMKEFSKSFIAVSLFVSNVLFWRESGYFAAEAEEKPLLHTWSLAVEEQYYVLFPLFLLLAWRYGKSRVFWMIVVLAAISLGLSEWGWRNKASANFYLAPTRAWELFSGSIAAFIVQRRGVISSETLSLAGLTAIAFAIFTYDELTPFPSLYTLVPVVGTVFVVVFAGRETFTARLLSTRCFVGLGLISYSAYLWHQPLFAFARLKLTEQPSKEMMLSLSGLSIFLAIISWRYVEIPFRQRSSIFGIRHVSIGSVFGVVLFLGLGVAGYIKEGFPRRIDSLLNEKIERSIAISPHEYRCHLGPDYNQTGFDHPINGCDDFFVEGKADVLMIGDSHLGALSFSLQKMLKEKGVGSYSVSYSGCVPVGGLFRLDEDSQHKCEEYNRSMVEFAEELKVSKIVLVGRFDTYLLGTAYDNGEGAFENNGIDFGAVDVRDDNKRVVGVGRIRRVQNHYANEINNLSKIFDVIVLEPSPVPAWHVPNVFFKEVLQGYPAHKTHPLQSYLNRISLLQEVYPRLGPDTLIVSTNEPFCDVVSRRCKVIADDHPLYRDTNHLSLYGAELLAEHVVDQIYPK